MYQRYVWQHTQPCRSLLATSETFLCTFLLLHKYRIMNLNRYDLFTFRKLFIKETLTKQQVFQFNIKSWINSMQSLNIDYYLIVIKSSYNVTSIKTWFFMYYIKKMFLCNRVLITPMNENRLNLKLMLKYNESLITKINQKLEFSQLQMKTLLKN